VSAATLTKPINDFNQSPGKSGSVQPKLELASESNVERRALVIGDLHGKLDCFEALLKQEGLLERCDHCEGTGDIYENCGAYECEYQCTHTPMLCMNCDGEGWARTNEPVDVILVGDIGHFGADASPTGDLLTWKVALNWADVILWGNHDRACIEPWHQFSGYVRPTIEAYQMFETARDMGILKLAHASHDFLITHAGLAYAFKDQDVPPEVKASPYAFADWINAVEDPNAECTKQQIGVRDAISRKRGGRSDAGGILWRDIDEKLYDGFRQVFGHSASRDHVVRYAHRTWYTGQPGAAPSNPSYCVDIGGRPKDPGGLCVAGVYLPDEKIVRVDL
jgi:hypothetical protein